MCSVWISIASVAPQLDHNCYLPNNFQFIIYHCHWMISEYNRVIKQSISKLLTQAHKFNGSKSFFLCIVLKIPCHYYVIFLMIQNAWRHILYSIVAINFRFRCLIAIYFNFLEEKDFAKIIFPLSPIRLQLRHQSVTQPWHFWGRRLERGRASWHIVDSWLWTGLWPAARQTR